MFYFQTFSTNNLFNSYANWAYYEKNNYCYLTNNQQKRLLSNGIRPQSPPHCLMGRNKVSISFLNVKI